MHIFSRKGEKCEVVYHIKCSDCTATYVGETGRALRERVAEHQKKADSHMKQHLIQARHSFSDEGVSILHQEPDYFKRGVAEAIYIDSETPSLNRDRGQHELPAIYREIITSKSRDQNNNTGHVTRRH